MRFLILFVLYLFQIECSSINDTDLTRKLPQAIIIGAKKSGTRALLKFIGAHHNVSTAGAEVHFFDRFYHMGLEWYKQQMPLSNENQITIEKTPKYLIDPLVPERAYKMNPNLKLIVVLRNPVTRAVSEYVQSQWRKKRMLRSSTNDQTSMNDSVKFERMLYDLKSPNKSIRQDWGIVRNGIYYKHIKQWLKYFPAEQFIFINGEQLVREPSVELNKLQLFLNLKPIIRKEHFVHNRRKGFACIIKPLDSKQVKCLSDQKGRKHPEIDEKIINDLNEFYKPFNKALFELINQDPWWPV